MIEIKGRKIFLAAKKNAGFACESGVSTVAFDRSFLTSGSNVEELAL
jgi:hypothetical protein